MTNLVPAPVDPYDPEPARAALERREELKRELIETGWANFRPGEPNIVDELSAEIAEEQRAARAERERIASSPLGRVGPPALIEATEPRAWAIDGVLIDGAMTLIAGKFKDGKSTLATELAVSLATGTPLFGLDRFAVRTEPSPVLVVQTENSDRRVNFDYFSILTYRGLDPAGDYGLHFVMQPTPPTPRVNITNPKHFADLLKLVRQGGFRWIVLDPIYLLVGADDANISSWDTGPAIIDRLTRLRDAGCTPIITSALKASGTFSFADVLGATMFAGWMETGLLIKSDGKGNFTLKVDVRRDRDADGIHEHKLRGLGVGHWELNGKGVAASEAVSTPPRSTFDDYLAFIAANPNATKEDAAAALGLSTRTIERHMKK